MKRLSIMAIGLAMTTAACAGADTGEEVLAVTAGDLADPDTGALIVTIGAALDRDRLCPAEGDPSGVLRFWSILLDDRRLVYEPPPGGASGGPRYVFAGELGATGFVAPAGAYELAFEAEPRPGLSGDLPIELALAKREYEAGKRYVVTAHGDIAALEPSVITLEERDAPRLRLLNVMGNGDSVDLYTCPDGFADVGDCSIAIPSVGYGVVVDAVPEGAHAIAVDSAGDIVARGALDTSDELLIAYKTCSYGWEFDIVDDTVLHQRPDWDFE